MSRSYIAQHLRALKFTRSYLFLSCLYGLSSLLIPFSVQLLVNNLALSGLWISTASFLVLIGAGLGLTLLVKYAQLVLNEYLQRHLLNRELSHWRKHVAKGDLQSPYIFESFNMLKAFAFLVAEGFDLTLKCVFGAIALIFIHPAFLVISLLFVGFLGLIRVRGRRALETSITESDRKYELYDALAEGDPARLDELTVDYFRERDDHFGYIRRQATATYAAHFTCNCCFWRGASTSFKSTNCPSAN